jgi:uncharacterized membrane protein YhaH (DUF805 family)
VGSVSADKPVVLCEFDEFGNPTISSFPPLRALALLFFSFKGRIGRLGYWFATVTLAALTHFLSTIAPREEALGVLLVVPGLSALAVMIKRAHDRNRSGYFVLWTLIPLIQIWPMIELGFFRGKEGANPFGKPVRKVKPDEAPAAEDSPA